MSSYKDPDRQMKLMMMLLSDLMPGSVCLNSACQAETTVPHMANVDSHPYPCGQQVTAGQGLMEIKSDTESFKGSFPLNPGSLPPPTG